MSDKQKKPQKLKARLPRGFVDRSAADIHATNEMTAKIREVYERYGFDPVETPLFEYTDAPGKFLPDSERPNEGGFSLTDDDRTEARRLGKKGDSPVRTRGEPA